MSIAIEILLIFLLLLANGVFAMSEIAVVTARRARLERLAAAGSRRAEVALNLSREPTQFLSTVQVGITLVGILAGAFGGAGLAERLDDRLETIELLAPVSEVIAFTVVVGAITYLSVIIGELVPKRIALSDPEKIATAVARPMQRLAAAGRPVIWLLTKSTNALFRLLPLGNASDQSVTEDDIRSILAQGTAAGAVDEQERQIAERVLRMGDRPVAAVMTPRPDLDWIDVEDPPETLRERLRLAIRSRFLVSKGSLDRVLGVVRADDILAVTLADAPFDLEAHLRQPLFVPSTMPVLGLLQAFQSSDVHIAIVLDEFGSVQGVATLNDILQDLVAPDPGSLPEADSGIVRREDGSLLVDGTVPVEEVEAVTGNALPAERRQSYRTIGGFVMTQLGHIPRTGEHFELDGFRFEVVDMDGRRIDRVLIVRTLQQAPPDPDRSPRATTSDP